MGYTYPIPKYGFLLDKLELPCRDNAAELLERRNDGLRNLQCSHLASTKCSMQRGIEGESFMAVKISNLLVLKMNDDCRVI